MGNLKPTTRTLLKDKQHSNRSVLINKKNGLGNRKEYADSLRATKRKMGSKAYRAHRLKVASTMSSVRKAGRTKVGYSNW